jgi:hypothetical protein
LLVCFKTLIYSGQLCNNALNYPNTPLRNVPLSQTSQTDTQTGTRTPLNSYLTSSADFVSWAREITFCKRKAKNNFEILPLKEKLESCIWRPPPRVFGRVWNVPSSPRIGWGTPPIIPCCGEIGLL